ncbi:efflux RND transporter periplasmic adaptor subunit [Pedobacter sp. SL55]|uniref:efflux RND transporter periplasmic adaptor subunit n=1 Tax=Pedobacter sp. SL55 TaxID=2995161 RepID=UPI00226E9F4E|nr:efflux RND transporter periplasmic adaptor subunit [Pedobacter sp. SL55]WAC39514.1 efflux RND transporter periplasmic adaptor subunit [Pedobacter sp. SL55]
MPNQTQKDHHDIGKVEVDAKLKALIAPSNEQVVAKAEVIKASYETKIFTAEVQGIVNYDTRSETSVASRVGGRLEKLYIKYNYQPVKKGQLLFGIYAPDLAAAQQELIYLSQSAGDQVLLAQAKQRLLLLGMSHQTIQQVLQSKKVNYRIPVYSPIDGYILEKTLANSNANAVSAPSSESGGDGMSGMSGGGSGSATSSAAPTPQITNSPVMLREGQYVNAGQSIFTIYKADQLLAEFALKPSLGTLVKKGTKLAFYKTADKEESFQTSTIGLIQPMIKAGENFTVARVYLNKGMFKAGEILTAKIPVLVPQSYWLPETAVVSIGAQSVAFKKENGVFVSMDLNTGLRMNGMVQVKEDIANVAFAKNAAYLVDSESFLKVKSGK